VIARWSWIVRDTRIIPLVILLACGVTACRQPAPQTPPPAAAPDPDAPPPGSQAAEAIGESDTALVTRP